MSSLLASLLVPACNGQTTEPPPAPPPPEVDPFADPTAMAIDFLDGQATTTELTVVTGTTREIAARVQPPGEHLVRFALVGQAKDAFLNNDLVQTDPDGIAKTKLTVLSASSSFEIHAAVGGIYQSLPVVTLDANIGTLILDVIYPGHRTIPSWVASVHVGSTCADLTDPPFSADGDHVTSGAGQTVQIDNVPANKPLAAVIRAGHFAGGCRNIGALKAGANTITEIDVVDRPVQLAEMNLRLTLSVDATDALNPGLDELAFRAVKPLNGGASNDLDALLDAMSGIADDSVAFDQARSQRDWVGVLVRALPDNVPGTGLRTLLHGWMSTGLHQLSAPEAIVGSLGSPSADGQAILQLESVSDFDAAAAGFVPGNVALLSAETDDVLRVGTTLGWQPTPFLVAAAERAAIAESPATRHSVPEALAEAFDCANVASLLVDAGSTPGQAYPGCGQNCMLTLCQQAMEVLWSRVKDTSLPSVPWQLTGATHVTIDADARPQSIDGNWIGSLTLSDFGDAPIQGPINGRAAN
jgi:hypothetical protein